MPVQVLTDQEVMQEAIEVLLTHLAPAKLARFWPALGGGGDYLNIRERLFAEQTIESLYDKIGDFQKS
jgi:hypothetical protein